MSQADRLPEAPRDIVTGDQSYGRFTGRMSVHDVTGAVGAVDVHLSVW